MRVLFAIKSSYNFSYISSVVEALEKFGADIFLRFDRDGSYNFPHKALSEYQRKSDADIGWLIRRSDRFRKILLPMREVKTYLSYKKRTDQTPFYRERWWSYLPKDYKLLMSFMEENGTDFEPLIPPDPIIVESLKLIKPDIVVATPMNHRFCEEVEYVKAAKHLGIPTAVIVLSWDNLTTKGLFHVTPDMLLVWNRTQLKEAAEIHGVPRGDIYVTGAPVFDRWLKHFPDDSRESFCKKVGLDPKRPYVLYLGSSVNISGDETPLVKMTYGELPSGVCMLARPHPMNTTGWENLSGDKLTVHPKSGELPEDGVGERDLHNAIRYCSYAIGINTSGMIDAIVHDKPCFSITPKEKPVHFRQLEPALGWRGNRKRFVDEFIRPHGKSAGRMAARAILNEGM